MKPYYEDERHGIVLYQGDCRDVLPMLDAVDHVITDPPYSRDLYLRFRTNASRGNATYEGKAHRELANLAIGAVEDILESAAAEFVRLVRRWMVIFHDAESGHLWRAELADLYVRSGVWVKPNGMPQISGDRPGQGFESITIGHARGRKRWNGGGRTAVWTWNAVNASPFAGERLEAGHPCPKPIGLMRSLVEDFTDAGETILDPFAGSGTTLVAAKMLGRKAIGIELEEKWCEAAAKRLEATTPPLPGFVVERGEQPALGVVP